jgi:hypothetical protein
VSFASVSDLMPIAAALIVIVVSPGPNVRAVTLAWLLSTPAAVRSTARDPTNQQNLCSGYRNAGLRMAASD